MAQWMDVKVSMFYFIYIKKLGPNENMNASAGVIITCSTAVATFFTENFTSAYINAPRVSGKNILRSLMSNRPIAF